MSTANDVPRSSGRWQLPLIAFVVFFPVLGAMALFYGGWRPAGQVNHGELIDPPRAWPPVELRRLDGSAVNTGAIGGNWLMVYVAVSGCDTNCEATLDLMQRLRISQGPQSDRVMNALIVLDPAPGTGLTALTARFPDTQFWLAPDSMAALLRTHFGLAASANDASAIRFVDPRGYYMMRFPPGSDASADPSGARKDLARLLKFSKDQS